MAEAKKEKGTAGLKRRFYKIDGSRITRERQNCPNLWNFDVRREEPA